jgi:hypothetical protein
LRGGARSRWFSGRWKKPFQQRTASLSRAVKR